jgi:tetratricopeptide (TPR) repeat protein
VNDFFVGLLSALMATNQPVAVSNLVRQKTGVSLEITDPNDPVEQAYQKLLLEDEAAEKEVAEWVEANNASVLGTNEIARAAMQVRVRTRYERVKKAYDGFLDAHPKHVNGRIAYASFLNDIGEETDSRAQLEQVIQIDPRNPAALNNLANYHGHSGEVKKAFGYYARAIEISPNESLYYQNFATTVFLFRKDAMEFYQVDEQQVFAKAMELYRKALDLDPDNFLLASEVAQTYYGVKPARSADPDKNRANEIVLADTALASWRRAMQLAGDSLQREGVQIHLARWQITAGRLDEARQILNTVTNPVLATTKARLEKKLAGRDGSISKPAEPPKLEKPQPAKPD